MTPLPIDAASCGEVAFPDEFRHGFRAAFLQKSDEPYDRGGYPIAFHGWPLNRRNAWWCGFNKGLVAHSKLVDGMGGGDE
jgi:hypothetical protein